jgi:hypothetical protein
MKNCWNNSDKSRKYPEKNSVAVPLGPPQIPDKMVWVRARDTEVSELVLREERHENGWLQIIKNLCQI